MTAESTFDLKYIFSRFRVYGDFVKAAPYGSGHINDSFLVHVLQAGTPVRYILQRINHHVFKDPVRLMNNVSRICGQLHKGLGEEGAPDISRRALTVLHTREDLPYYKDGEGNTWRVYLFIEGALGYDIIENEEQAFQAAWAFGDFQKRLKDLPGERLHESIPGFHDTPRRYRRFLEVLEADCCGLNPSAQPEIDFFLTREKEVSRLAQLYDQGLIPERVIHNDTKLNNVLIDKESNRAICVIDLDTSMPGLLPYDFGDLVRSSTTSAAEDEKDLSRVLFLPDMFKALTRGYLSSAAEFLVPEERDSLVLGGKVITIEQGLRFLADYLEGNVYYKTKYPEHNLIRCRTQMALIQVLEARQEELNAFVAEEYDRVMKG